MDHAAATDPVLPSAEERARAVAVPETSSDRHAADLAAARDGDREAMDRLIHDLTPLVWHVARSNGCTPHEAEDVVQNTWLALFRQLDQVRDARALPAWLVTTARRDVYRAARLDARVVPLSDELVDNVESTQPAPEEEALRSDHDQRLWRAFAKLSHRNQDLLRRLVINKEPHHDVARALGLSVGSVGPLRVRALNKLRELVKEQNIAHPVDAALVDRLRAAEFTGREFDLFAEQVIDHTRPIVSAWIHSGRMIQEATRAGRRMLRMPEDLTPADVEHLVHNTVTAAWTDFVTALKDGRWTPDISLNDHYLDLCVRAFPPIYHAFQKKQFQRHSARKAVREATSPTKNIFTMR
ncbi:RNA polymerase sigma factor [Amycolatopsis lurida]|uniref:RNA polymerase sigma factor n=1 Tax=Amycolatopsis lurida TaxID=31959 RepID=UPI003659485B